MPDKQPASKNTFSADWFMRGALTRIGDMFDRLTGRRWIPSSSLATSGLIERLKRLMDAEARQIPGKGTVVPHNIKLKMQWDKFSTDADDAMDRLETELLTAAADHINDSLYYTYAPLTLEVKRDYFTEGVKLFVGFDAFTDDEEEAELNVTVQGMKLSDPIGLENPAPPEPGKIFLARFATGGSARQKRLVFPAGGRLSVGRSRGSGLALDDASVSKIHASLAINPAGVLCVADTGSTNGTFINSERISYGTAMEISDGDRVKFGLVEVEFEHLPAAAGQVEIDSLPSGDAIDSSHPSETVEIIPPSDLPAENDQQGPAIETSHEIEESVATK